MDSNQPRLSVNEEGTKRDVLNFTLPQSTESSFLARVEAPSFGDPASFFAHTLCERGEPTQPS
jgi:hypothetical protein